MTTDHEIAARERDRIRNWHCPSCQVTHRSVGANQYPRHACAKHNGLDLPLIEDGRNGIHILNERQDFLGDSQTSNAIDSNGRVIMSAYTEFADGSHETTVFIPCAMVKNEAHDTK